MVIGWFKFTFRFVLPMLKLTKAGRAVSSGADGILSGRQEINVTGIIIIISKLISLPFIITP